MKFNKILKITLAEIKLTFSGFGRFYIEYFRAMTNIRLHPLAIADWLVMVMFFLILFLHPFFPPAFKLLSSLFVILVSYFKTKSFVKNARFQPHKQHARIRGGILALFPFYLVAVTTFIWGLWEVWPDNQYQAQQLRNASFIDESNEASKTHEMKADEKFYPGKHHGEYKVIREQKGNPLLNVLNDAYPKKTPPDKEFIPEYDNALSFWIYSLKVTLRMNFAGITEFFYNNIFVNEEAGDKRLYITRLDGWHEFMLVLEVILQLITSILFLGIIADIALSVQRKIQTGEIDIDLSRDYAIELLKSVKNLDAINEVDFTVESWNKIKEIQNRAIENLMDKLHIEIPTSYVEDEKILKIRNDAIIKKVAAILTLGNFKTQEALDELVDLFNSDSLRIRCAAIDAVSRIDFSVIINNFEKLYNDKHDVQKLCLLKAIDESTSENLNNEQSNQLVIILASTLDETKLIRGLTIRMLGRFNLDAVHDTLTNVYDTSKDKYLKAGIVYALGALNFEDSITEIFDHMFEKDYDEIMSALLHSMRYINTDIFKDKLLEIIKNNKNDDEIRNLAILTLGNAKIEIIEELLPLLDDDQFKLNTLITLGEIIRNTSPKQLTLPDNFFQKIRNIIDSDAEKSIQIQACLTLAKTKDSQAFEILINELPKPEASIALGILGNSEAVPHLLETADKTNNSASYNIEHTAPIEALGNLGSEGLIALEELYNKRKKDRALIALVIARMKTPEAVDFLLGKFHPESLESCKILAPALANTQDDRVKRPLLNAVTQNPDAAGVITQALLGFEDETMVEEILKLISVFNDEIRNEVFEIFKFYRPNQKNTDVFGNMQKYLGSISSKAENWARKLNKILRKHTIIVNDKTRVSKDTEKKIDLNALDEFD